ncbi:pleckstrin homology domain-containing family A member 1-like isoform X2 [Biomphalaria glabrata]|uniref:Pleckstrin homology domain-containing family A member 1-like isoform X2 n=1 Tax=Biomphalaria glabrata TaxID=6526 RepID=A0A2C9M0F6_BIOGL|nr:pleckstrin homology domain-containing family A member 1-like isoform X2 [Biomphalaria glabrata]
MPYQDKQGRHCGFLNIEETEGSGSFCRRFFVLDHNNEKLVYYMDNPDNLPDAWKSPVGEIYIHNISKVSDGAKQRPKVQYCLTITVAGRQYFLQAEEDADKWKWIEAIKNASKIKVPPKLESSSAQKEWRAADVTQEAYITEIAGGVVCKMPIQSTEIDLESNTDDSESRSSSSGRISPTSSLSRGIGFSRDSGSIQEPNKTGTMQNLKPLKSGYCVKQGAVRKNWKRRFFVLYAQGLSYYKSEQEKQAIRTIPIEDILDVRQSVEGLHPNRDNLFEVRTTKRIFFIQCDTPEEMRGWIDVVNSAMSQKQKHTADRKSMQDGTGRHPLDDELCSGTYPSPIWKHHFMSAREKSSKDTKHQKKSFILW